MKSSPPQQREIIASEFARREATLEAVKTLLRSVGYDEESIVRSLAALDGPEAVSALPDQLLTAQEVCRWLGISLSTVWRWKIPHIRVCGPRRFYRRDVEKFLNSRYVHTPKSA